MYNKTIEKKKGRYQKNDAEKWKGTDKRKSTEKKDGNQILYFHAGLGWVTKERLMQPDVQRIEEIKAFECNQENRYFCSECPHNRNFSDWGGNRPCGQQNCMVAREEEEEEE